MKSLFKKIIVEILTWEAKLALRHYVPRIIAITGSVGKTSTKDMIYSLIERKFDARRSEKSFNSDIGVPLTILGLRNAWSDPVLWLANILIGFWNMFFSRRYPRVLVLEVGADAPHDIEKITTWLKPDIAVVTALADVPVHIANFPTVETLYEEKSHLVRALKKDGTAVLNADDKRVILMKDKTAAKKMLFGTKSGADVVGSEPIIAYTDGKPSGIKFNVDYRGESILLFLKGVLGFGFENSALAATATALALGMTAQEIGQAAEHISTPVGRMRLIQGLNGSTIIDDSYNSSPVAALAALEALEQIETSGKKIAALGDMRELGSHSKEEHIKIGEKAAKIADILITVGPESSALAEAARKSGMSPQNIFEFMDSRKAGEHARKLISESDVILAKGSQNTIRMEWFVEKIMAHPEQKKELLVRQDKEWKNK